VSLVGTVLAQATKRPNLAWKFIVLDTDGVNAFAAPGGYIHITRGALGLIGNEAELADVLAHEIIHVTEKHTIAAIQKGKMVQMGANQSSVTRDSVIFRQLVDKSTEIVLLGFGRAEELEADQKGVRLANSVGYSPSALGEFLTRLTGRNKGSSTKQGLFASHPQMQERLDRLSRQIASERLASTATLQDRYRKFISYTATPQADIATVEAGAAGLTGGTGKSGNAKKDEPPPKKKGFGLGSLLAPGPSEKRSAEVTGSAAARGADTELGAKGGPVKTIVVVNLTPADIEAFKKEGNLR
jgi:predicted Zn-dependent protease